MPPKTRMTVAQLKAELDTLGVPYDAKAKKAVLVDLLEKVRRERERERERKRACVRAWRESVGGGRAGAFNFGGRASCERAPRPPAFGRIFWAASRATPPFCRGVRAGVE